MREWPARSVDACELPRRETERRGGGSACGGAASEIHTVTRAALFAAVDGACSSADALTGMGEDGQVSASSEA